MRIWKIIMTKIKSRWKICDNDVISDISLEFLKQELLELVEEYKRQEKIENDKCTKDMQHLNIAKMKLSRLASLLTRISGRTQEERKPYAKKWSEDIEIQLKRIYAELDLQY